MTVTPLIPLAPAQIRGLRRLHAGLPIIWTRACLRDYHGDSSTAKGLAERGLVDLANAWPVVTDAGREWLEEHP